MTTFRFAGDILAVTTGNSGNSDAALGSLLPGAAKNFDTSALEVDFAEQAGLRPLPVQRMFRQAGRPMSPARRSQPYGPGYIPLDPRDIRINPALHEQVIQRNLRNQEVIENWDPVEAEWRERSNRTSSNPRSRASSPSVDAVWDFSRKLFNEADRRRRNAFSRSASESGVYGLGSKDFRREQANLHEAMGKTPASEFLTSQERQAFKSMLFQKLDEQGRGRSSLNKSDLPPAVANYFPKLGNDILYEWNAQRQRQMRENTLDMLELSRNAIRGI